MSGEKKPVFGHGSDSSGLSRRDFVETALKAVAGCGVAAVAPLKFASASENPRKSPQIENPALAKRTSLRERALVTPHHLLQSHYEVVVIGSGYGGSILAARLAQKAKSICILERGAEWKPGDFLEEKNEWKSGDFPTNGFALSTRALRSPLNPLGLLDMHAPLQGDVDVISGSGLGGTSLINAAISIRPEPLVFEQKEWPKAIQKDYDSGVLDAYYSKAEVMLGATEYDQNDEFAKTSLHKKNCEARGVKTGNLKLNVNYDKFSGGLNALNARQDACTFCGDCVSGCNVGAKNTLTTNYLPLASKLGAQIFTGMEVREIEKGRTGYRIHYTYYSGNPGLPSLSKKGSITASKVVLAAGSKGTTEILLRSQNSGFRFSKLLGSRFSANGDVLGFSYNGNTRTNIVSYGDTIRGVREGWPVGHSITCYGDYREKGRNLMERYLLLDGTIPTALLELVGKSLAFYALQQPWKFSLEQHARIQRDLLSLHPKEDGALNHSMLYLACGHDSAGGRYVLEDKAGSVHVKWPRVTEEHSFKTMDREMAEHAKLNGGMYVSNPRSTVFGGKRIQATHPLGGCPMGETVDHGVVDHRGRVFTAEGSFHEGLFVADGSMIPRSLGATPLITISAFSERIADYILGQS
ncbi:MAG: GMC family oxidoreductase [Bdellovibrionota bacterium]